MNKGELELLQLCISLSCKIGSFIYRDSLTPHRHAKAFQLAQFKLTVLEKLKKTALEYTLFNNGFFMDYFCLPK